MLLFLASLFVATMIVSNSSSQQKLENIIMLLVIFLIVILAAFRLTAWAVISVGLSVIMYAAYKLFLIYGEGAYVESASFAWLFLPLLCLGGMFLFLQGYVKTELHNEVLRQQVDELVMIDPLTGLYNLRSLYNDLERLIAYAYRNNIDITVMIVQLRYSEELKKILSKRHFDMLIQRMVEILQEATRIEDKMYVIDSMGTIAVVLTCNEEGAQLVKGRIKSKIDVKSAFEGITDAPIKVDTRIAYVQYDKSAGKINSMELVKRVEGELQYDV